MDHSSDSQSPSPQDHQAPRNGRYRYSRGSRLDPSEKLHPELSDDSQAMQVGDGIPNTLQELIAMQANDSDGREHSERPEKPVRQKSAKVSQVLELIESLETSIGEDQEIALALTRHLESYHNAVVEEMRDDADRLGRARNLMEP